MPIGQMRALLDIEVECPTFDAGHQVPQRA